MNFVSFEEVIVILDAHADDTGKMAAIKAQIERLRRFPAPNPNWRTNGRNIMGQTPEQFDAAVEAQYPPPRPLAG